MPAYTRESGNRVNLTRGETREGLFRTPTRNRPGLYSDQYREEAFIGDNTTADPNRKLVYGSIDDRGRVRSHYFTDEKGRLKIPYGSMLEFADYNAAATSIALTVQNTYYGWTTAADSVTYGDPYITFLSHATADRLVINPEGAGVWWINFAFSIESGGAAIELTGAVFKNGTRADSMTKHQYLSGTNDMGSAACSAVIELEAADYLDVRFAARNGANKSIDIHHLSLSAHRINHKR
jgi:hypothetical protein